MNRHLHIASLTFVAALASPHTMFAAPAAPSKPADQNLVKEEQLVRFAYTKLRWYLARDAEASGSKTAPTRIEIKNMRVGNLKDIIAEPAVSFVSLPGSGETPNVTNALVWGDDRKGQLHVGFRLKWYVNVNITTHRDYSRLRTVADLIEHGLGWYGDFHKGWNPEALRGWERYATYDLRFVDGAGHDETYQAISVFAPIKAGELRAWREANFVMDGGVHRVVEEERQVLPRHYWRTGSLTRTAGAFGMEGTGGPADTPRCQELQNPPTQCYSRVCCDDAAGAAACCWRAEPATGGYAGPAGSGPVK